MEYIWKNKEKGITLIALVITIIILLILAGVGISALTKTGLFKKANQANQVQKESEMREELTLAIHNLQIEKEAFEIQITLKEKLLLNFVAFPFYIRKFIYKTLKKVYHFGRQLISLITVWYSDKLKCNDWAYFLYNICYTRSLEYREYTG